MELVILFLLPKYVVPNLRALPKPELRSPTVLRRIRRRAVFFFSGLEWDILPLNVSLLSAANKRQTFILSNT
jgi:hypothetical protein